MKRVHRMWFALYELCEDGQAGVVDEYHLVGRVVDDVVQLLQEQTRVDSVQNGAHTTDCVVELDVAVCIPCNDANHVSHSNVECSNECVGELLCALVELRVGAAVGGCSEWEFGEA